MAAAVASVASAALPPVALLTRPALPLAAATEAGL